MSKKKPKTVQNTPGNIIAVDEGVLMLARVPGTGTRATRKKRNERRKEDNLRVGKVEILEHFK